MHRQRSTTAFSSVSHYLMNGRPVHAFTPVYINMMWLTRQSAPVYNYAADSSVCPASNVVVVFSVRLSWPGLHQHARPHQSA